MVQDLFCGTQSGESKINLDSDVSCQTCAVVVRFGAVQYELGEQI